MKSFFTILLLCSLHVTTGKTWISSRHTNVPVVHNSLRQSSAQVSQTKMKELKMPPKKTESAHLPNPMRSSITQTSGIVTASGHHVIEEPVQQPEVQKSEPVNSNQTDGGDQVVQQQEEVNSNQTDGGDQVVQQQEEINGGSNDDGPSSNTPYLTPMETIFIAAGSLLLFVVCAAGYFLEKKDKDENMETNGSEEAANESSSLLLSEQENQTSKILF